MNAGARTSVRPAPLAPPWPAARRARPTPCPQPTYAIVIRATPPTDQISRNSFILAAVDDLLPRLGKGTLVVLESTTFPGFTREVLVPRLADAGHEVGRDVLVAFSPERVDPGNARFHTKNTPKVVGGVTPGCLEAVRALYATFLDHLVPVSSTDAAEMVKLLENTFRAVNIGLVNEVALMCAKLGLDTWEVIDAAATKPFGSCPSTGPGLGGTASRSIRIPVWK